MFKKIGELKFSYVSMMDNCGRANSLEIFSICRTDAGHACFKNWTLVVSTKISEQSENFGDLGIL